MDDIDKKILDLLVIDAKQTTSQISKKTLIPITTVHNRIKKMESQGIITQYTIKCDYEKLNQDLLSFILITVDYGIKSNENHQENIAKQLQLAHEVVETHIVAGTTDIMIKVRTKNMRSLNSFVTKKLRTVKGIDKTQTILAMESFE